MLLPRLQSALRAFQTSGKAFELITTTTNVSPAPRRCRTLVILDSSFNPPTIAHMQMATSALRDLETQRDIASTLKGGGGPVAADGVTHGAGADGLRLLLLLAVNNADKAPKPASFEQRLLMMRAFAGDLQHAWREAQAQTQARAQEDIPVDIGLTKHPYFHEKSAAIASSPEYDFAPARPDPATTTVATEQIFLAGYDTLIRIFNPKYYVPPVAVQGGAAPEEGSQTTPMQSALGPFLARARLRVTMRTDADWGGREEQIRYVEGLLAGDELEKVGGKKEWARRVEMVEGLDATDGLVLSSTEARKAVAAEDWERLRRLVGAGVAELIEKGEVSWEESKS